MGRVRMIYLMTLTARDVMTNEEAKTVTTEGFEILCMWSRNIAMLPLEDWRDAMRKAETLVPIMNPTLCRLFGDKAKILNEILDAAIKLKVVVMKHQAAIGGHNDTFGHEGIAGREPNDSNQCGEVM